MTIVEAVTTGTPVTDDPAAILKAARILLPILDSGTSITSSALRDAMERASGGSDTDGTWLWKHAYEAAECAQVLFLQKYGATMRKQAKMPQQLLTMIETIASLSPSQTKRSDESQALQQFSTPLPLAFAAAHAAAITADDLVLEPSAGTGLLAAFAAIAGADLHLNEISQTRAALLAELFAGSDVTRHDAGTIHDRLNPSVDPSAILMNPPFSAAPGVTRRYRAATAHHLRSALARLRPGGRLVLISGASFTAQSHSWRSFFDDLQQAASVVFTASISGKAYARHGTTVETRLTVFDKVPQSVEPRAFARCETAGELLDLVVEHCPARLAKTTPSTAPHPAPAAPALAQIRAKARATVKTSAAHPLDNAEICDVAYQARDDISAGGQGSDEIYEPYEVQTIAIDHAKPHPGELVQSAAMASVQAPLPSYRPRLPAQLIADGVLSAPQLETVIYAGEAHETFLKGTYDVVDDFASIQPAKAEASAFSVEALSDDASKTVLKNARFRRGFFLGDGTGCGKGRQVAAVILDNWLKGRRKALWISRSDKLIEDARRDWQALGGAPADIIPISSFPQGRPIPEQPGILFVTYATLRSQARQDKKSRLAQILDWIGHDFDGVIAFDEAHAMANAISAKGERGERKPSEQGRVGLLLQNAVPSARVLYVSATGATTVSNLAYASRLGLWQTGDFPFSTRADFIASMEDGGIAAMEVISRDLKALGLYTARLLSFKDVEYEMLVHELTEAQTEIYDAYANAYQIIHQNLEKALEAVGITADGATLNPRAKSAARSAFEGNKQRFFNHLITAMKCPSVLRAIQADIDDGHAPVVQIVSTGEALMERRIAEIPPSEWKDLNVDVTPREYVLDYLNSSFPTQLFEAFEDENGELRSRPVHDANGNPVVSREALEARDELIEHLGALPPVQSALDQIICHFGTEQVAEITGRSRRIVKTRDGRMTLERRPASSNYSETDAFMGDSKKILAFSDAGGTGRSYHADLAATNTRKRVHYLLEAGWRADAAIQGLGRTHRTNQAQPPLFRPCATNVKGEKRFLSTIARRLDSLGAITKGQRQTGGQNMFRPEDNLESDYARAALRRFFSQLYAGKIPSCSLTKFEEVTGLALTDHDGSLRETLPPISQFLNRCLALTIAMQNTVFEAFTQILDGIVEEAIEAGTYEVGLETLTGERFMVKKRVPIYEHGHSKTEILTIERLTRNKPMSLDDARRFLERQPDAQTYLDKKTGAAAIVIPSATWFTEAGDPIRRVQLIQPMFRKAMHRSTLADSSWKPVERAAFERAWATKVETIPQLDTSTITIVAGLLLPIWQHLPQSNTQVYRLTAEDGERVLGRMLTHIDAVNLAAQLGVSDAIKLDPEEVLQALLIGNAQFTLSNKIKLRRSKVMDRHRIEMLDFKPGDLKAFKALGCYTETIAWKTRLFVPDDESVLAKVLEGTKIVAVRERWT